MTRYFCFFVLLCCLGWSVQSAKILAVFPMPAFSHFSVGFRLAKELADRGHQVTAVNPHPQKTPIKNYREVIVSENIPFLQEANKNLFDLDKCNPMDIMKLILHLGLGLTELTFKNQNLKDLMNSGETFDVVLIEHFLNDAHMGLGLHFNAPIILISSTAASATNNYIFANPAPASYVPNIHSSFTRKMDFWERLQNFFYNVFNDLFRELVYLPAQRELFKKYIKTDLELDDVLYNVSLMLTNSHVSVNDPLPHVPSIIEIGGYHINPPKKLPEQLQKFLDESDEGVVLFSMGSNLKSKDLKLETREAILKAFSKIKQRVLWKFEEDLPNLPKNVKIMQWVPQQDVLAHPNVKAFVTHGGLLSTIEAIYFGVPVIGIPVFGDQKSNIANAVNKGYAVSVPLSEISEEKLYSALKEILNNPKYTENVKRRSSLMNDQPLKPIDNAVYWVEHVIRNKGAPHLRSGGIDLKWYQRHMVDIISFLILSTIITFVIFYVIVKKIVRLFFGKKSTVSKSKKNK